MKRAVIFILILNFFQGIWHNLGHPVTPAFVTSLGIPDFMFGVFFALMALGLVIGSPIWGTLGDSSTKAKYALIGLLLYSVGQVGFGFSNNMYLMSVFRFLSGFGVAASITLMMSHIIEHSTDENRSRHLAWYAAVYLAGSSSGYYLGGLFTENSFLVQLLHTNELSNIFLIQAVINVFHALSMYFMIRADDERKTANNRKSPIEQLKEVRTLDPLLLAFLVSLLLISLGAINLTKYIEVFMSYSGFSPYQIGIFVLATGGVSLFANVVITPLLAKLKINLALMVWIQFLSAIIILVVFRLPNVVIALYTLYMGYIILKAVYAPLEQSFIASFASPGSYGKIMGVRQSFFSIGMVIGPLIGGVIYNYNKLLVFDVSALMFFLGFILLLLIGRQMKTRTV